jgi:hypothetical protein
MQEHIEADHIGAVDLRENDRWLVRQFLKT